MVRLKHRYLLINILYPDSKSANLKLVKDAGDELPFNLQFRQPSPDQLTVHILLKMIRQGIEELFGDYGSGKVSGSLQIKYWSPATSTTILRVSRDHYRLVWAALAFVTSLPKPLNQPCVFQVVRVSGTIRKAQEEAVRRARLSIRKAQKAANGPSALISADSNQDISMYGGIDDSDEPEYEEADR